MFSGMNRVQKSGTASIQSAATANTTSETDDNQLTSVPSHIPDTHQ
jgi:hypothetical protein